MPPLNITDSMINTDRDFSISLTFYSSSSHSSLIGVEFCKEQWLSGITLKTNTNSRLRLGLMHKALLQLLEFLLSPTLQGIHSTGRKKKTTQTQQCIKKYTENKKILHMHTVESPKAELM